MPRQFGQPTGGYGVASVACQRESGRGALGGRRVASGSEELNPRQPRLVLPERRADGERALDHRVNPTQLAARYSDEC